MSDQVKPFPINPKGDAEFQKILEKTPQTTILANCQQHLHWGYMSATFLKKKNYTLYRSMMSIFHVDRKVSF
jgi:hypothetical protein